MCVFGLVSLCVCILSGLLLFDNEKYFRCLCFVSFCAVYACVCLDLCLCVCILSGWLPFDDEKHFRWFACYMAFLFYCKLLDISIFTNLFVFLSQCAL